MLRRCSIFLRFLPHYLRKDFNLSRSFKTLFSHSSHQPSNSYFALAHNNQCQGYSKTSLCSTPREIRNFHASGCVWTHTTLQLRNSEENSLDKGIDLTDGNHKNMEPRNRIHNEEICADGGEKVKRKKLKGKRAVVRWLKSFRWKKKKEYERMTAEEKILYKLKKAHDKQARLVAALRKIDPQDTTEVKHDPEVLTPEEHFYFLKLAYKSRNYVPVGRRGIYQGVILNMHLHWKKHQTLKVKVKTFTPEEVREIAAELARLSGGIVLEIYEENTIIMYRGKNYVQPPTEIMSPKTTLPRKKALDKSKYRDSLRAVRQFIPRLEQNLELLKEEFKRDRESENLIMMEEEYIAALEDNSSTEERTPSKRKLAELLVIGDNEDDGVLSSSSQGKMSESSDLSDIFETDSEEEIEDKPPLYLDEIERFPSLLKKDGALANNFEEHLRRISAKTTSNMDSGKKIEKLEFDEIDRLFLRAGSLLKKKR
ncbi:putative CRM domain-containing protein, chloroplastic [Zostera marina]|uniref:Putative CRM domain-containing protein, chloroplastic n=1 Tax=Zostera marina TaxID=29655 RepID=A0A0K9P147_ZOSMR|nr:putative CRM domain-containing protein, chloroplastic [Zostera marina]